MHIIVQKFGGTSLSNESNMLVAISHVKSTLTKNKKIIIVVSAMGRLENCYSTDNLITLMDGIHPDFNSRTLDLLLSCGENISAAVFSNLLLKEGIENTVLTGGQAGIITDNNFNNAKIINTNSQLLFDALKENEVIIVTGFQGITEEGYVTTLGRGGSDMTACILGSMVGGEVQILSDVDGIMTSDPSRVSESYTIVRLAYESTYKAASLGAKVIHPKAIEIAKKNNVPVKILNTFKLSTGTLIENDENLQEKYFIVSELNNVFFSSVNKKNIVNYYNKLNLKINSLLFLEESTLTNNTISILSVISNDNYRLATEDLMKIGLEKPIGWIKGDSFVSLLFKFPVSLEYLSELHLFLHEEKTLSLIKD